MRPRLVEMILRLYYKLVELLSHIIIYKYALRRLAKGTKGTRKKEKSSKIQNKSLLVEVVSVTQNKLCTWKALSMITLDEMNYASRSGI